MVIGYRAVGVAVEGNERVDKIPHGFVVGVEDVRTVLVHVDAFDVLARDVAAEVRTFVNDKARLTGLLGSVGKGRSEETRTNYEVVVMHKSLFTFP